MVILCSPVIDWLPVHAIPHPMLDGIDFSPPNNNFKDIIYFCTLNSEFLTSHTS